MISLVHGLIRLFQWADNTPRITLIIVGLLLFAVGAMIFSVPRTLSGNDSTYMLRMKENGIVTGALLAFAGLIAISCGIVGAKTLERSLLGPELSGMEQDTTMTASAPDSFEGWIKRGDSDWAACNLKQAVADYTEAIARRPNSPDGYRKRANVYGMMQSFKMQKQDLATARQLAKK